MTFQTPASLWMLAVVVLATLFAPLPSRAQQEWTWFSGAKVINQDGVYSGAVAPGARTESDTWTDSSGNLWLFGGGGYDAAGDSGALNDLWEFTPSDAQWHWLGGNSTILTGPNGDGRPGVYGQLGTPASGNIPGGRAGSATWADQSGNFWLFGGGGQDANNTTGFLNDLWEYSPSSNKWTWWGGSTTVPGYQAGEAGNYGSNGWPGGRNAPASWIDTSGNFWLFGGEGFDKNGVEGDENDLWKFSPASKQWTFVSGSETVPGPGGDPTGVYGPLGTAGSGYTPGGRFGEAYWHDAGGNLWLFGGNGADGSGGGGDLNDLWMFDVASNEWAWMGGAEAVNQEHFSAGNYGPQGTPGPNYFPSGRFTATAWTDAFGNFWLLGGEGTDSSNTFQAQGWLNELWEYNPAAREWTFVDGNSTLLNGHRSHAGNYGSLGVPSPSNLPGSRLTGGFWSDTSGDLWLFGGQGTDSNGNEGLLNDLWKWGSADVMVNSGAESTVIGMTFASDLQVTITHNGSPVSGVTVTFTAPSSGASGTFAGGGNTAVTNSSGIATAPAFTANATVGTYEVVATASGANTSAFALSNVYYAAPVSVTPNYGFGMSQQFSFVTQQNAGGGIAAVWMMIAAQASAAHSCSMSFVKYSNMLYLMNDAGSSWGTGGHPGASATLTNSQCSVSLASTTVTQSGSQLTVAPTIAFTAAYAGAKRIFLGSQDSQFHNSGLVQVGIWSVGSAVEAAPSAVSVTPSSGSGLTQQFSFVASSPVGAANLAAVYMFIGPTNSNAGANSCYMKYLTGTNMLYLAANDGGSDFGTGGHPGSVAILSNSQCTVNLATTTVAASGTRLTVSPAITFNASFTGTMIVDLSALDAVGESSGLVQLGTWTP